MFSFSRAELNVGDQAPSISATTQSGTSLNFADVYKKGYTLVYFFPKADTPGCTAQGCSLRDNYQALTDKGVTVIGVSSDAVEAQRAFKDKYHFPFELIADTDATVIHAFGQPGPHAIRQAYLIDKQGKIVWRDLHAKTEGQADDVLSELKTLGV